MLVPFEGVHILLPHDTERIVFSLLEDFQRHELDEVQQVDFSSGIEGIGRFRANAFKQRNTYALALLVPGVRPSIGVNNLVVDQISTVSYAINGQRAAANEFLLDGAPNSAPSQNQPVINANPDAVQEFKVNTNQFKAEQGLAMGGVVNVVTKSGTNEYHGELFEYFRDSALNNDNKFTQQALQLVIVEIG